MSSTDEAAAFELTAPGSGEDTRAAKPPPAPGERGRRYKQGCSREQLTLLPPSVNQYVAEAEQDCFHCPGGRRLEPYRKPVRRDGGLFKGLPGRML